MMNLSVPAALSTGTGTASLLPKVAESWSWKRWTRRGGGMPRSWAELVGAGMTCDAFHITSAHPDGQGAAQAMTAALNSAGINADEVDYINAHGTATPVNDPIETKAIRAAFGDHAYRTPVSSTKSMTGHAIGAAGALEAMICVKALEADVIPPTINLDNPDPDCDLDYVPHQARSKKLNVVMSNSFAFGGQNCVLIFREFDS